MREEVILARLDGLKSLIGQLGSLTTEDYDILYGELEALQYSILGE
jgi:hypothetical protein